MRAALRLGAVYLAAQLAGIALLTSQRAHVPICVQIRGLTLARPMCGAEYGMRWQVAPTVEAAVAGLAALAFAFAAVSPRQGSTALYRWRRAVY